MIAPPREAWRVFDQAATPSLQVGAWRRNAARFFDLDFAVDETSGPGMRVTAEGARRVVVGRARDEGDLRDALAAENAQWNGLYDLAERRCRVVWIVEREGSDDRVALRLAATIATVALGPILGDGELFGVRTAREKLAKLGVPYR